jgi:hypothetical protein
MYATTCGTYAHPSYSSILFFLLSLLNNNGNK